MTKKEAFQIVTRLASSTLIHLEDYPQMSESYSEAAEAMRIAEEELAKMSEEKEAESAHYSYHFDVGNSNEGPLGMCGRITARTPERALEILRWGLAEEIEIPMPLANDFLEPGERVEYMNLYTNADKITVADIDFSEDAEDLEEEVF